MRVLVGSENPTKVEAVKEAFARYFDQEIAIVARSVESRVSHQPINAGTFEGAKNRAVELGDVMDRVMGEQNTKQKGGAVSFFTRGLTIRKAIYDQAVTLALIPFVNTSLYFGD